MCTSFIWVLYHKLGSLKQLKFVLSQFSRPEFCLSSWTLGWIEGVGMTVLPPEAQGETLLLVSLSFWWLVAFLGLWLPHIKLQGQHLQIPFCSICMLPVCVHVCMHVHAWVWMKSSSLKRTFMILHLESTQKIQDNLHLKIFSLISSAKTLWEGHLQPATIPASAAVYTQTHCAYITSLTNWY